MNNYMVTICFCEEYKKEHPYPTVDKYSIDFVKANTIEEVKNTILNAYNQTTENICLYEGDMITDIQPTIKKIIINKVSDEEVVFDGLDKQFIKERDTWWKNEQNEEDKREYERLKKKFEGEM